MTTGTETPEPIESTDGLHDALRNLRRRYVVIYLDRNDGAAEVDELAESIAAWENGNGDVTAAHRKSVYSALHQTHLPKLERVGLAEYDRDSMTVRSTDGAHRVTFAADVYQSLLWPRRYLALCALGTTLLVGRWLDVGPLADVSALVFAAVLVVGLAALAGAQYVAVRRWSRRFGRSRPDFVFDLKQP